MRTDCNSYHKVELVEICKLTTTERDNQRDMRGTCAYYDERKMN